MLLTDSQECDNDGTFTVRYEDGETQDGNRYRHTPIDFALARLFREILRTMPQFESFRPSFSQLSLAGIPESELRWVSGPSKGKATGGWGAGYWLCRTCDVSTWLCNY